MRTLFKAALVVSIISLLLTGNSFSVTVAETSGGKGTAYYVSSSGGNDSNDGKSAASAWKTFKNVKELRLTAGDKVLLKRGDEWRERLEILSPNGTADNWVYIGPYGELSAAAPVISLNNDKDDICVLVQDLVPKGDYHLNYVWIDNLTLKNTTLGIYFRYVVSDFNKGVRVTDCEFENINCPEWSEWLSSKKEDNGTLLAQPKGRLSSYQSYANGVGGFYVEDGGGVYEYFIAVAVFIGGKPLKPMSDSYSGNRTSDIEIQRLVFKNCNGGIMSSAYWSEKSPTWGYTKNWWINDIYAENSSSLICVDNADFGWDGTENSQWGIIKNVYVEKGFPNIVALLGVTHIMVCSSKNLLVTDCFLTGSINNGYADGCSFDFERNNRNIHLRNSVIANNQGQGVLMMQTNGAGPTGHKETSPNSDCSVVNSLFYNNLRNIYKSEFCYDFLVWNDDNENILVKGNQFIFTPDTAGNAEVFANAQDPYGEEKDYVFQPVGKKMAGFTITDNTYQRAKELPSLASCIEKMGLTACLKKSSIQQKNEKSKLEFVKTKMSAVDTPEEGSKSNPVNYNPFLTGALLVLIVAVCLSAVTVFIGFKYHFFK